MGRWPEFRVVPGFLPVYVLDKLDEDIGDPKHTYISQLQDELSINIINFDTLLPKKKI